MEKHNTITDLFKFTDILSIKMQGILNDFSEKENSYEDCEKLLQECQKEGYTFDYGLDAIPYNLNKIAFKYEVQKASIKSYLLNKMGFSVSVDGFIITKTLFSKWVCDGFCSIKSKPVLKLHSNFYIINK
jgi:hypothetical protein